MGSSVLLCAQMVVLVLVVIEEGLKYLYAHR